MTELATATSSLSNPLLLKVPNDELNRKILKPLVAAAAAATAASVYLMLPAPYLTRLLTARRITLRLRRDRDYIKRNSLSQPNEINTLSRRTLRRPHPDGVHIGE